MGLAEARPALHDTRGAILAAGWVERRWRREAHQSVSLLPLDLERGIQCGSSKSLEAGGLTREARARTAGARTL
jgi:hypothetical protein